MTFREYAPMFPLIGWVIAVVLGANPADTNLFVAAMVAEIMGIYVYVEEIRYRFRNQGRRR